MNSEFKENLTRFFGNAVFALKQHSPEILLVAGNALTPDQKTFLRYAYGRMQQFNEKRQRKEL